MKGFIIGVLLVALIALAYIYYQDENTITIGDASPAITTQAAAPAALV